MWKAFPFQQFVQMKQGYFCHWVPNHPHLKKELFIFAQNVLGLIIINPQSVKVAVEAETSLFEIEGRLNKD